MLALPDFTKCTFPKHFAELIFWFDVSHFFELFVVRHTQRACRWFHLSLGTSSLVASQVVALRVLLGWATGRTVKTSPSWIFCRAEPSSGSRSFRLNGMGEVVSGCCLLLSESRTHALPRIWRIFLRSRPWTLRESIRLLLNLIRLVAVALLLSEGTLAFFAPTILTKLCLIVVELRGVIFVWVDAFLSFGALAAEILTIKTLWGTLSLQIQEHQSLSEITNKVVVLIFKLVWALGRDVLRLSAEARSLTLNSSAWSLIIILTTLFSGKVDECALNLQLNNLDIGRHLRLVKHTLLDQFVNHLFPGNVSTPRIIVLLHPKLRFWKNFVS